MSADLALIIALATALLGLIFFAWMLVLGATVADREYDAAIQSVLSEQAKRRREAAGGVDEPPEPVGKEWIA